MSEMDSREKLEEDILLEMNNGIYAPSFEAVQRLLDRQAAITERELQGCPGYDADRHYCKYHANDFELTREQVCDLKREVSRLERERDELQAKLDQCMESYADAIDSRDYLRAQLEDYDETHMPLPLDADGVLIRIGDKVDDGTGGGPIEVMSLTYFEDCCDVNACGMNPRLLRHVKPRTIEDVLRELVEVARDPRGGELDDGDIEGFAEEIRELMGGDA